MDIIADTISFFWVDTKGHFMTQKIRILPRASPLPQGIQSPGSSSHNLTLPNPFKAMKQKSSDNLSLAPAPLDPGRIILDDNLDAGVLLPQTFVSLKSRSFGSKLRGVAWTNRELTVGVVAFYSEILIKECHRHSNGMEKLSCHYALIQL